jgi:hypothetical protein
MGIRHIVRPFAASSTMRREDKNPSPINVIWVVQSPSKKYFDSLPTQINCICSAVSSHWRGGSRSSRTRGGMRWTPMVPITNGAEADGKAVWS